MGTNRLATLHFAVAVLILGSTTSPVLAQSAPLASKPGFSTSMVLDNDKVRVFEATWKPGSESPSAKRPARVVRATLGGTLSYIYADGRIEKVTRNTGEVYFVDADLVPFSVKNESDAEVVLLNIFLK